MNITTYLATVGDLVNSLKFLCKSTIEITEIRGAEREYMNL